MAGRFVQNGKFFISRIFSFARSQTKDPAFWHESFLLVLANVIVTGLGLIRTPLITWIIPKDQVGMLGVVASWMPFLQLASLTGLDTASYHYISKGQPWAFIINISYRLRWSLFSTLGFLIGAVYWFWQKESALAWLFIIAGISYPLTIGLSAVGGTIGALERYRSLFWFRIWESLTDFTGFIPLLLSIYWVNQIVTFYGSNQIATLVMQVSYSIWLINLIKKGKHKHLSQQEEKAFYSYGKHQTGINSISVLNNRLDAVLVSIFLPLNTMADYSIALLVYEQLRRFWNIYVTIRYPKLVRIPKVRLWQQFLIEGSLVIIGFALVGLTVAVLGFWLIPILLPPSYVASLRYMSLLILAFLASIPAGMSDTYFRTQQDPNPQYYLRIIGVLIGVVASLILLPNWGAAGVAAGRIFASIGQSIVACFLFIHKRPIPDQNE